MSAVIGNLRVNLGMDTAQFERGSKKAQGETDKLRQSFGRVGQAAASMAGAVASAGVAAGIGALTVGAVREAQKFETTMFRVQAVIDATGGAAGRSADQLRDQARELARGTLESTEGILRAQQTLLTFRNVQGDVFDRAIESAADMSAALGGDLNAATLQLAKALEDPITGMTALTRSGTVFTQGQKDTVRAMVETGRIAEAQNFILAELEAQYGGTAEAAAGGLAGAQDTLAQSFQEFKLEIADSFNLLERATRLNLTMADAVDFLAENMDRIVTIGGTVAALMSGRFFVGFVAARGAMIAAQIAAVGFNGALAVMRGALLRTGIGIFAVAAGELVYRLTQLSEEQQAAATAMEAARVEMGAQSQSMIGLAAQIASATTVSERFADAKIAEADAIYASILAQREESMAAAMSSKEYTDALRQRERHERSLIGETTGFGSGLAMAQARAEGLRAEIDRLDGVMRGIVDTAAGGDLPDSFHAARQAVQDLRRALDESRETGEDINVVLARMRGEAAGAAAGTGEIEASLDRALEAFEGLASRAGGGISFRMPGAEQLEGTYGNLTAMAREQLEIQQQIAAIEAGRALDAAVAGAAGLRAELTLTAEQQERFNSLLAEAAVNDSFSEASADAAELTRFIVQSQGGLAGLSAEALTLVSGLSQASLESAQWSTTLQAGANAAIGDVRMMTGALQAAGQTQQDVANNLATLGFEAATESVREFQREVGAAVDGIVGPETLGKIEAELAKVGDAAEGAGADVARGAAEAAGEASRAVDGEVEKARESGRGVGEATVDGLTTGIAEAPTVLSGPVRDAIDTIASLRGEARVAGTQIGADIVAGMESGISAGRSGIVSAARSVATAAASAMRDELDIHSPSRETYEIGEYAGEGLGDGIRSMVNYCADAARQIIEVARDTMADATDDFKSIGKGFVEGILGGMADGNLAGGLSGFLGNAQSSFTSALTSGQGLGSIFSTAASGVGAAVSGAAGTGMAALTAGISAAAPVIGAVMTGIELVKGFSSKTKVGEDITTRGWLGAGGGLFEEIREEFKKTSWWGLKSSKSIKTSFKDLDTETQQVRAAFSGLISGVRDAGAPLGIAAQAFQNIRVPIVDGNIAGALSQADRTIAGMIPGLSGLAQEGETVAQTLGRLSGALQTYNDTARVMRLPTLPNTVKGAGQAARILGRVDLAGAQSALFGMMDAGMQLQIITSQINRQMSQLGLSGAVRDADDLLRRVQNASGQGRATAAARLASLAPDVARRDALRAQREEALRRQEAQLLQASGREAAAFRLEVEAMPGYLQSGAWELRRLQRAEEAREDGLRDAEQAARDAEQAEQNLAQTRQRLAREVAGFQGFSTFREEQIATALAGRAGANDEIKDVLENLWATMRQIAANTGRQADDTSILVAQNEVA